MLLRRLLLVLFLLLMTGCVAEQPTRIGKLTVGIVSYDQAARSIGQYERFRDYLAAQTKAIVELEPAYNELNAVEQVQRHNWSIVFAPSGLAAIAIDKAQYVPLFPTRGVNQVRSVIIVRKDSSLQTLSNLTGKVVALGEPGSATGYYLPLYDLYGLALAEIRFAPTPKTVLEWISQGTVVAGALSEEEYERYYQNFGQTAFRILHHTRKSPPGVVLLGPTIERNQQEHITRVMSKAPLGIADDAGYIPNARVPDYQEFIKLVNKVKPLEIRVHEKPAVLTINSAGEPISQPQP
jgi:phosphonate transport system substrate-binding protein